MVFADFTDALAAINGALNEELRQATQQEPDQLVLLCSDAEERIYGVGHADGLRRALAIIEEFTQPDDYT